MILMKVMPGLFYINSRTICIRIQTNSWYSQIVPNHNWYPKTHYFHPSLTPSKAVLYLSRPWHCTYHLLTYYLLMHFVRVSHHWTSRAFSGVCCRFLSWLVSRAEIISMSAAANEGAFGFLLVKCLVLSHFWVAAARGVDFDPWPHCWTPQRSYVL